MVHVHELGDGGLSVRKTCRSIGRFLRESLKGHRPLVHHPPVVRAFGYRCDARDRAIVISRDTALSDNLIKLGQGAEVVVHDALYVPGIDPVPPSQRLGGPIPQRFERLVLDCLRKDPALRSSSAAALAALLAECAATFGPWTAEHADTRWRSQAHAA